MSDITLVCGKRNLYEEMAADRLEESFNRFGVKPLVIVHGGARGGDRAGMIYCLRHGDVEERVYPADWDTHGRAAGPIRNQEMLDCEDGTDLVVAFWDGESKGTFDMIKRALSNGITVIVEPVVDLE